MRAAGLVAACGGIGATARFGLDGLLTRRWPGSYPLGTLAVNLSGCFLLGLLAGLHSSHEVQLVLGTATLGSYTTFSTWMLETRRAAEDGRRGLASQSVVVALAIGFGLVAFGRQSADWRDGV